MFHSMSRHPVEFVFFLSSLLFFSCQALNIPILPLRNAAVAGLTIPAIGLGTGGYAFDPAVGYGGWPQCWAEQDNCGEYATLAIRQWLVLADRANKTTQIRLDLANTYYNTRAVGEGIQLSGVPRKRLFILEKLGPGAFNVPLGYQDAHIQFEQILRDLNTTYVDILLIHWPEMEVEQSQDVACRLYHPRHNFTQCRLNTWRALTEIHHSGRALAIGVSNFNVSHLEEIKRSGMVMPAGNQIPINLYTSSVQNEVRQYCKENGIAVMGYSPLGVPDWHMYPQNANTGMSGIQLEDERLVKIARTYNKTTAQVLLQWQYSLGITTNPRSQNARHMLENLESYTFQLSADDIETLNAAPQDNCSMDSSWYECLVTRRAKHRRQPTKTLVSAF